MKLKHYVEKGYVCYVTSVTHLREKIFLDASTARFLLMTIAYHKYILEFKLFGYVIMPDHFHILIQSSEKYPLSKIMNFIKGSFARKYNEFLGRYPLRGIYKDHKEDSGVRHVWQKRYHETVMRNEKDVLDKLKYTHNNPVKCGLGWSRMSEITSFQVTISILAQREKESKSQ